MPAGTAAETSQRGQPRGADRGAQAWVDDDPDHETRVELGAVIARAKDG